MRKHHHPIALTTVLLLIGIFSFAQAPQLPYKISWSPVATYSQFGSQAPVSFVIGNKAYCGTGSFTKEFWEYDPATNTWTQKADFPGEERLRAVGFSIGNKGYLGTGQAISNSTASDFWEYDPATNTWTQKASMPVGRRQAVGFSIGSKGYVGTGAIPTSGQSADFWEYDPTTNTWTQKANFPGAERRSATGFSVGNKGYIGTGRTATITTGVKDFWEYDPTTNTWTQKTDFGGAGRVQALGFSTAANGYLGCGTQGDFWQYNPQTNSWSQKTGAGALIEATGFAFGDDNLYTGLGVNNTTFRKLTQSYWEVRNSTGDYDEANGAENCYLYSIQNANTSSGYIECPADNSGCYIGFAVNTSQNLGNFCYKSRVDANVNLRGGYVWNGSARKEYTQYCRRNYTLSFQSQPVSPVGFQLYYTKAEIDNLLNSFNAAYGTNKSYSDLIVVKYNGPNQDLDPSNNSNSSSDYQKIIPSLTFYGNAGQFAYAEFSVSSYSEFYLALTTPYTNYYVNDNNPSGDVFTSEVGSNTNNGSAAHPFGTINYAVGIAQPGDTIVVDAGMYPENITVNKSLTIRGAKTGNCPGASLNRGNETIITPPITNFLTTAGNLVNITAADVKLDGLTLDGDNPTLTSGYNMNGADVDGFSAITNNTATAANMQVVNCIIKNFNRNGIGMSNNVSGINISCNHIDNLSRIVGTQGIFSDARAVNMFGNNYGTITNNHFTRVSTGVIISSATTAAGSTPVLSNNTISSYTTGILFQAFSGTATPYEVTGNTITTADYALWNVTGQTNPAINSNEGIRISGTTFNNTSNVTNNNISGCNFGFNVNGVTCVTGALNFTNNNISTCKTGMTIFQVTAPGNINITGGNISGSNQVGVLYTAGSTTNSKLFLDGVSLSNNTVGVDASYSSGSALPLQFNNTTISGGIVGLRLYGNVTLPAGILSGINFSGQSLSYIRLTNYSFQGQVIDATSLNFEGLNGAAMTLAQRFAVEDKILHQVDYNGGGFIRIRNGEVYVTPQSFVNTLPAEWGTPTTVASVQRGIAAAVPGDIVNVAAGTYIEQLSIDKALTLKGEGAGQTIIARGASGVLTPLPGKSEAAIIQTTAGIGDVIIQDLAVDGSNGTSTLSGPTHAIMLQTGGAVRNCEIKNMQLQGPGSPEGNGILVGYTVPDPKTIDISNNNIHGFTWVGVNIQGNNISATITNNIIDASGAPYGMAIAAGGWGSDLASLNIANNDIKNYNGFGISTGSIGGLVNNNSIAGIGNAAAIINNGATVNATCNWFGTIEAELIKPKITGSVTYGPWLTNGADNDAAAGFQPVANACNGRQNKFYVNDNYSPGVDVFTTAAGDNSNNGFSTSPFATIDFAYSVAQAGDTIFIDAGNYDLGGFTYSFPKAMTFLGANYLVSPNDPANKLLPNGGRNAESVVTNGKLSLASNGVSFEGFTIDMGNRTAVELVNSAVTNNDFGNFKFTKNILKITNTTNGINQFSITGKFVSSPNMPVTSGYTIADNRFEKSGSAGGNTFNFNYVKNINVTGNSFLVTGTTLKTQQVANLGGTGLVELFNFSNNTISEASTAVSGNRIASAVVSNNKIYNTNITYSNSNTMVEGTNIEISNNEIATSTGVPFQSVMLYTRNATSVAGTTNILKVENNTLSGVGIPSALPPIQQFYSAMNFTVFNGVLNPSIIIRGNKISYTGDFSTAPSESFKPVQVRGNIESTTIENNEITVSNSGTMVPVDVGAFLPANPAIIIGVDNGLASFMTPVSTINILNNKISGFKQSVVFYDVISGHNAYQGYGNVPAGATVNINNNSFTSDSISINSGITGEMVNATCNWYGSSASQNVSPKITETTVNHSPWLTNGADTDVATGFQPVANSCNGVPVDADIVLLTNVSCNGADNGSIEVLVEEGLAPFTYSWFKDDVSGFSTLEDLDNLEPGVYKLIVTDANGSIDSVFADISEPLLLTASADGANVNCFGGSNGSAIVTAEGGTAPYTYLWSNGATTDEITDLIAGNYSVTVTDANGCTANANYLVTQPTLLTAVATGTSTACFNSITVVGNGGSVPYAYLWNNGATTSNISSIAPGTYSVIVTDAKGCTANASATVTANEAFNPSASIVDVSCYGGLTGKITVTNVNAVAPFAYSIDGGLHYRSIATFDSLPAGTYTITVQDANGCTGFVTKTIAQPLQLTASIATIQSTCFGLSTGAISVTTAGGTAGYSYSWSGPNGYTSSQKNISGLAAGTYNFTITDSKGCTASLSNITVTTSNQIIANATVNNIACKGETNGSIVVNPTGGSGSGFTYLWNNGSTTNSRNNLGVGNYSVTITDIGTGCLINSNFTITQPASLVNLSTTKTNATSCAALGTITATGSGGVGGYQYKLDNGSYQSSGLFTGLYAGSYTVWVKDANGCTKSAVVSITDNGGDEWEGNNSKNQAKAITSGTNIFGRIAIANDAADWFKFTTTSAGSYTLTFIHPSASFVFNLYAAGNNTPALTPTVTNATSKQYTLAANATYYISITGGLSYVCYTLNVSAPSLITKSSSPEQPAKEKPADLFEVKVLGNPTESHFNIVVNSSSNEKMKMRIVDVSGRVVELKENLSANQVINLGNRYRNGVYYAEIRQGNNIKTIKLIKL